MTTVKSIDRVGGTPADISISKLDESLIGKIKSTPVTPDGVKVDYKVMSGEDDYPTVITVQVKNDRNGNGGKGVRSALIALNSFARVEVDGVVTAIEPISCALTFTLPTNIGIEVGDLHDMIENLFSLTYTTVTTKEGDNNRLTKFLTYGLAEIF